MSEHAHEWEVETFYVDRCKVCGKTESIFVSGHDDVVDALARQED